MSGRAGSAAHPARRILAALSVVGLIGVIHAGPAAASGWPVPAAAGSQAVAAAQSLPVAPANPTSTCSLIALQVSVAWSPVPHATGYGVYQSTTGSSGSYSLVATVSATAWTSPILMLGSYWYRITAFVGSWTSPPSSPTAGHSITLVLCT